MSAPQRIQRKRTKGWRMPENSIYVGRPSKWGNPYPVYVWGRENAVRRFREVLADPYAEEAIGIRLQMFETRRQVHQLRGKNLACWCPLDQPCHADVLLELANSEAA